MEQYVELSITDSGSGIPESLKSRIFDPFFTTKPVGVGTGLGLSVVYGIIDAAGGRIEVDSTPGRGTEFRIYLPSAAASAVPNERLPIERPATGNDTIVVV